MSDFNLTHPPADGWTNPAHLKTRFSLCKNGIQPTVMMETPVAVVVFFSQRCIREQPASILYSG